MRSLKVLLVEDDSFQLMAMHQMLNACNIFDVMTAQSVEAAQGSLERRGPVDIAICDLQMDGPNGLDLLRHLAGNHLAKAVLVLSSAEQSVLDSVAHLARQQGLNVLGSLRKPATVAILHEICAGYLAQSATASPALPLITVAREFTLDELYQVPAGALHDSDGGFLQWVAHFQPKVDFQGGLQGVEALARWQHPQHGLLAPGAFLPALEAAGLQPQLAWRMLHQALELAARYRLDDGRRLPVAVNFPPQLLELPDFADRVLDLLDALALPAEVLTLEIVETGSMPNHALHLESLLRLRLAGCKVAIDDFGTGVSNIERLLQLPFSELKIPAEFVRGMLKDERKTAIIAGTLAMAERMGLTVVVEGVETAEEYAGLQVLGAPWVQGYFIARPMAEPDLLAWMENRAAAGFTPGITPAHVPEGK